jgi:hypothetical protein
MWREDLILKRAEDSAKIRIRKKSNRHSLREWDTVSPSLVCGLCKGTPSDPAVDSDKTPPQWFVKSAAPNETKPAALPPALCPQCMFGMWNVYTPARTEFIYRPDFARTEFSIFSHLWKRHKDTKTMEEVNILMNDKSYNRYQRPKNPDRLSNHLKRKGYNYRDQNEDKENRTKTPLPPQTKSPLNPLPHGTPQKMI